jgi:hypothetical protein
MISRDDDVSCRWNKDYQVYASTVTTPMTTRHISLDYIITSHPPVPSQILQCVDTMPNHIVIIPPNTYTKSHQLSSPVYEETLKWHPLCPLGEGPSRTIRRKPVECYKAIERPEDHSPIEPNQSWDA